MKFRGIASVIILALVLGLVGPLSVGLVYSLGVERHHIEADLTQFHDNTVNLLALSMQNALLAFAPNEAQNTAEVVFHDPRILGVDVYSSVYEMYLARLAKTPPEGTASPLTLRKDITVDGEDLGYVAVTIDRAAFFADADKERVDILVIFAAMLAGGLVLTISTIYVKALRPIARLTRQARRLSTGNLETSYHWQGDDELSVLGKTFEDMRRKLRDSFRQIRELAITDDLTGLPNRRAFLADAAKAMDQSRRYGWPLSMTIIDLDHFKQVNDAHGHSVGDLVLQEFGLLVSSITRRADMFARIGGEEFALCMPKTGLDEARAVAEKIREQVQAHAFPHNLTLTASLGVALFTGEESLDLLLEKADVALYRAKNEGRNRVAAGADKAP